MKSALLTLSILMASQNLFAASCETHFKRLGIPAQKVQRVLSCDLVTESNDSRNVIFLNNDELCIADYTDIEGNTKSSLSFISRGKNKVSLQVPHKNVVLERDVLTVTDLNLVTRGGILPLFYKKSEIIIVNNSTNRPSVSVNLTEGKIVGGQDTVVFAGNYECRKGNSLLNILGL